MGTFLGNVAGNLYKEYGDEISSLNILFPNNRAKLFFNRELSVLAPKPIWQPIYRTIDDLMCSVSGLSKKEHLSLVAGLFKEYSKYFKEDFSSFYHWGELMLADFDMVDKYMIDAGMLFRNLSDLKDLDADRSYLSEEQIALVRRFWENFSPGSRTSAEKERFISIWNSLPDIYSGFRDRCLSSAGGYTGMIYRDAAEKIKSGESMPFEGRYAVVGFNALSRSEKILLEALKNKYDAWFFWDTDPYFMDDPLQEAGMFMRENVRLFPPKCKFPTGPGLSAKKNITVVKAPSDSLQAKYTERFLKELGPSAGSTDTAVVLTDEQLLMPVLYSIPEEIEKINITMGYPFTSTTVYSFIDRICALHLRKRKGKKESYFNINDVRAILKHPYVQGYPALECPGLDEELAGKKVPYISRDGLVRTDGLSAVFPGGCDTWDALSEHLLFLLGNILNGYLSNASGDEFVTRNIIRYTDIAIDHINRLRNKVTDTDVELNLKLYVKLLKSSLRSVRVPFEGEPLEGLQVMGILETRTLDFKNILILSMSDPNFPGKLSDESSFVPYNLRVAYGLPTSYHHEGVHSYYFYRLVSRAQNITMAYCSKSEDTGNSELSRYIRQLQYESGHDIRWHEISPEVGLDAKGQMNVEKTPSMVESMMDMWARGGNEYLSASALGSYMTCPMSFYLRYIAKIRTMPGFTGEIDPPLFGTILHRVMEKIYAPLCGESRLREKLSSLNEKEIETVVNSVVKEVIDKEKNNQDMPLSGNVVMAADLIKKYLIKCLIPFDISLPGFSIERTEYSARKKIEVLGRDGSLLKVSLGGNIDRLDKLQDGSLRIVDYKTGFPRREFESITELFSKDYDLLNNAVMQVLFYCFLLDEENDTQVIPALYFIRELNKQGYSYLPLDRTHKVPVMNYSEVREEFEESLKEVLANIFNASIPFVQSVSDKPCQYCDFRTICGK